MLLLEKITASTALDVDRRNTVDGMQNLFSTKPSVASAYLCREIFAMTGPLSRILQGVNIGFGKAFNLLDAALEQLSKLRSDPKSTLLRKILIESSRKRREFQEGGGCQLSFPKMMPKMNLQYLQKKSGDMRYSTQLLAPLLSEEMNVFVVADTFKRRLLFFRQKRSPHFLKSIQQLGM